MRFRTTLLATGKNTTGIELAPEQLAALGGGKKPALTVRLNGFEYRTSVGSMGGKSLIPVSAERRETAGVRAGDEIEVELELDTAPREVTLPPDLETALAANTDAKVRFAALAYSHQQRHVLAVEGAKTSQTREKRIAGVIAAMLDGK